MWRRSWSRQNIFGENGDGDCTKRKLLPDERSIWDDYLDMATPPNTQLAGQVCISAEIGYTPEQLSSILKTDIEIIKRANKRMEELKMITVENSGIVVVNNYYKYQSEYTRQKAYRQAIQSEVTSDSNKPGLHREKRREEKRRVYKYIRDNYKSVYTKLLSHWNSLNLIKHKKIPDDRTYGHINGRLDDGYTQKEILQAMSNYAYIINGKKYFWSYKWTLGEFVKRGLDKFMDLEVAKKNYADKFRNEDDDDIAQVKKGFRK